MQRDKRHRPQPADLDEDPNETGSYASPPCFMHEVDPRYLFAMSYDPRQRITVKKIHADSAPQDGRRILVERLWPRGVSKSEAALDAWEKGIAPSSDLRKWYAHEPQRWPEFQRRYREELAVRKEELEPLLEAAREGRVTLLFSTRDEERNSATVLREVMIERLENEG